MRIIGGHDYYDSAQAYGHDPKVVFVRDKEEFLPHKTFTKPDAGVYFVPADKVKQQFHWRFRHKTLSDKTGTWSFWTVRVIFCGVMYTGIKCTHLSPHLSLRKDDLYFWSRDEFQAWVDQFELVAVFKDSHSYYTGDHPNMTCIPVRITGEEYNTLINNRISISIHKGEKKGWEMNCTGLRDVQFYKVFSAVMAFQELDMWMSGALGMPGNPMVEVSDEIRAAKHGMDKWSFRKKVR